MNDDLKAEIAKKWALANAAKPSPWVWVDNPGPDYVDLDAQNRQDLAPWLFSGAIGTKNLDPVLQYAGCGSHECESEIADRAFIAESRTLVPRLLAALELAIEQRDDIIERECSGMYADRWKALNAAILARLRGEA